MARTDPIPSLRVEAGTPPRARLERLRELSRLLDNAIPIPGTRYRIGIDPILGLVPGLGDLVAAMMSAFLVVEAERLGAPRSVVWRMLLNVVTDTLAGSVPVAGDVFDAAWKANARNMALLDRWMQDPRGTTAASRRTVGLVLALLGLVAAGAAVVMFLVLRLLIRALAG
jgi:hypothetical protein